MSDLVGNLEDRFSRVAAHFVLKLYCIQEMKQGMLLNLNRVSYIFKPCYEKACMHDFLLGYNTNSLTMIEDRFPFKKIYEP